MEKKSERKKRVEKEKDRKNEEFGRGTNDGRGLFAVYQIFHEVGKGTVMAGTWWVIDRAWVGERGRTTRRGTRRGKEISSFSKTPRESFRRRCAAL